MTQLRVFKFSAVSGARLEFVKRTLEHGEIYFCPPADLNDPFEYSCSHSLEAELEAKIRFWSMNEEIQRTLIGMTPKEKQTYIEAIELQLDSLPERLFQNGSQGVFCSSGTWQNLVLWSHYAENHKGIVIEFETEGVEILSRPEQVQYSDTLQTVQIYKPYHVDDIIKVCSRKYIDWSYEKEIRFFCSSGAHRIPVTAIKSVIFGMNCRRGNYPGFRDLYNFIRNYLTDCEIYEVNRSRTSYQLERQILDRTIPAI